MKLIDDLFKDAQGLWDISRIAWAGMVVGFLANAAWAAWSSKTFNAQDFGVGAAALLAGGGFGVKQHSQADV